MDCNVSLINRESVELGNDCKKMGSNCIISVTQFNLQGERV